MRSITLAALAATGTLTALAAPATAYASPIHAPRCVVVHDHIAKTDTGHGTPAAWADLSLNRTTKVCGGTVTLVDTGTLATRTGAGTPNGTGGQITRRVPGVVHGTYHLTVSGGQLAHQHGDTTLSSTEYVKSLFTDGTTVSGGAYAWTYATRCERWVDSSANDDGQGAAAGNITGRRCPKPSQSPTASPSTTPTAPSGGSSTPTTVPVGAPQTGDGSTSGGGANMPLVGGGILLIALGIAGAIALRMKRRGQHH
ncbi:MAG: hypothetical protein ACRDP6_00495 [Actinoallomurus sp.]